MFPSHITRVLDDYAVPADTKAALYDLYVAMGEDVLEVFSEIALGVASAAELRPDDTLAIRGQVVERYLVRNHPLWLEGRPTPSFWCPRGLEGRASGAAVPLGRIGVKGAARWPAQPLVDRVALYAAEALGDAQPLPAGVVMLGKNAHFGGRLETVSFDVVAGDLDDAIALGRAAGQQHTMPGSMGETSGTIDSTRSIALLWEVQPNVYKPAGERNRAVAKLWRRHRNWHVVTLLAAVEWLREHGFTAYVLRGAALAVTHEVNPRKPVSSSIAAHHDRTLARVVTALGASLGEVGDLDELALLDSAVMNHALRKHVLREGAAEAMWKVNTPS